METMQVFTVHYRSESASSLAGLSEDALFVKEGFSWPAFVIPAIWLLYKRMWWVLAGYMALQIVFTTVAGAVDLGEGPIFLCSLALNLVLGFEANELYRWSLARRRFRMGAVVTGSDLAEAEQRFFSAHQSDLPVRNKAALA